MTSITLPEIFHDFDSLTPELNEADMLSQFSMNQTRAEEITMIEDYDTLNNGVVDTGFGFPIGSPNMLHEASSSG